MKAKKVAVCLASLLLASNVLPSSLVVASADTYNGPTYRPIIEEDHYYLSSLNSEQLRKYNLAFVISDEYGLTSDGKLYLKSSEENIKLEYGLSDEDAKFLVGSVVNYNKKLEYATYSTRASFSGGYIHLSYYEVLDLVNLAASYGPAVIIGAMSTMLSVFPGVGTIIGGAFSWFGYGAILQTLNDAASQKKGIKIGIGSIGPE